MTSARALQIKAGVPDSQGTVDWNATALVNIKVTATISGTTRTVEANFTPGDLPEYYDRLMTVKGPISVDDPGDPDYFKTLHLQGTVWQQFGGVGWATDVAGPDSIRSGPTVPIFKLSGP